MPVSQPDTPDVLTILGGATGIVAGMSMVPSSALAELEGGAQSAPALAVAACSRLAPDFLFVPAWEPWADEASDRVASCGTDVFWVVPGPFGVVAERDGWSETLHRTLSDTEGLRTDLTAALPALVEHVRRGARLDVKAVVVADDLAGSSGMLVSPDFALDVLLPLLGQLADAAAEQAIPAVLHSDGDTRVLLHAVRRFGFAGVHPGGLTVDEFEKFFDSARREGLGVLGGIDGESLRSGTPSAIAAGERVAVLALRGGLLLCDDGGITTGSEVSALMSAINAARG